MHRSHARAAAPARSGVSKPVTISIHRWAGAWGPFRIKIPCGECALTGDIVRNCIATELADLDVRLEEHEWLSAWWRPLRRGGWHAPIIQVNGKVISQGVALNRGVLVQAVIEAATAHIALGGNHVYGKPGCPHCAQAREALDAAGIEHAYHDVIADTRALYEMLARVKPLIGPKTPVTVPQIWIEGAYVGGADQLAAQLATTPTRQTGDPNGSSRTPRHAHA